MKTAQLTALILTLTATQTLAHPVILPHAHGADMNPVAPAALLVVAVTAGALKVRK